MNQVVNEEKTCFYYSVFPGNGPQVIRDALIKRGVWKEIPKEEAFDKANFIWKPTNFNYKMYAKIDKILKDPQAQQDPNKQIVVNHLENIRGICTKTGLVRTLKQYYKDRTDAFETGYSVFDSTPTTFVVTSQLDTYEFHQFVARYQKLQKNDGYCNKERTPQKHCKENYWLVKPANMNQGRGIEIFNSLQDIQKFLSSQQSYTYWVIQKYIEKPLLFKGRKFDIRVWGFASHKQDFYFYQKGYLRTSSDEYSLDNENNYVHLTNNCLQKFGDNYGKHEDGNTVGFEVFQQYLDKMFPQFKLNVQEHFIKRIKDLMIDVYLSVRKTINPSKRKNSFELFGFDFLIDEDFRVWLIEVNTNPYLGIPNDYIRNLLPKMIDDLFQIVLDPVFTQDKSNNLQDNQFELLYSQTQGINKRRQIDAALYPIEELAQVRQRPQKPKYTSVKRTSYKHEETELIEKYNHTITLDPNQQSRQPHIKQYKSKINSNKNSDNSEVQKGLKILLLNTHYGNSKNHFAQKQLSPEKMRQTVKLQPLNIDNQIQNENENQKPLHFLSSQQSVKNLESEESPQKPKKKEFSTTLNLIKLNQNLENNDETKIHTTNFTPRKTITEQVNLLNSHNSSFKKDMKNVVDRIVATFMNWELFSDKQIQDTSQAFNSLAKTYHFSCFSDENIIENVMKILGSKKTPTKIKLSIMQTLILIMKNVSFRSFLLNSLNSPLIFLQQIIEICLETCNQIEYDEQQYEFYQMAIKLLISIISLQQRKFYIPGETKELEKLRQKSMDYGLYSLLAYLYMKNYNDDLKNYIQKEFIDQLEEFDYNYLLQKSNYLKNYYQNQQFLNSESEIEAFLKERYQLYQEQRQIQLKEEQLKKQIIQLEYQKKKEQAEKELEEKRRKADEQFTKRMEDKRKMQLETMKKEMIDREQFFKDEEEKRKQLLEQLRKKEEMRKQMQYENYRKRLEDENKKAEETEKKRQEKAEERKKALEEWHKQKARQNSEHKSLFKKRKATQKNDSTINNLVINESTDAHHKGSFSKDNTIDYNPRLTDYRYFKNLSQMSLTGTIKASSKNLMFKYSSNKVNRMNENEIIQDISYERNDNADKEMKPSKSLKALKKKQNQKEQIIQQQPFMKPQNLLLPSLHSIYANEGQIKLKDHDIRLFSVYGLPQQKELLLQNKKPQKSNKIAKKKKLVQQSSLIINSNDDIKPNLNNDQ